jgi:hypothetical protein
MVFVLLRHGSPRAASGDDLLGYYTHGVAPLPRSRNTIACQTSTLAVVVLHECLRFGFLHNCTTPHNFRKAYENVTEIVVHFRAPISIG